jgi:hypothetical protein
VAIGVGGDSEGAWETPQGGRSRKRPSPRRADQFGLRLWCIFGGFLGFRTKNRPAFGGSPARDPLHARIWPKPVRRVCKKERQKPLKLIEN